MAWRLTSGLGSPHAEFGEFQKFDNCGFLRKEHSAIFGALIGAPQMRKPAQDMCEEVEGWLFSYHISLRFRIQG